MRKFACLIIILFCRLPLAAQNRGLIVYPLACQGLTPELASRVTAVFEQSLFKTGLYRIINYRDFQLLLQAQGLLLSGIFDDSQVLAIGRLLPAELLARGEVETSGSQLTIRLRILDLSTGQVLGSEIQSGVAGENAETVIRRLVFRMAGRPEPPAGESSSAQYLSLTVTADRKGAEVFIDGRLYGTTPLLIDNMPAGPCFLELRAGSLYYAEPLNLERHSTIYGVLKQRFGSLVIDTEPGEARVTMGDTNYGVTEFLDNIPAKTQDILLRKAGLFWKGQVPVLADQTVRIDVALIPAATINIKADDETLVKFYGENIFEESHGSWQVKDVLPGTYLLEAIKPGYQIWQTTVEVAAARQLDFIPNLQFNAATLAEQTKNKQELTGITGELAKLALPEIYLEQAVPQLETLALKNTFFALIPGLDFLILFDKPLLPYELGKKVKTTSAIQFAGGLLFQLGLAAYFLVDDDTLRSAGLITALAAGGIDLGLGIIASAQWGDWSAETRAKQTRYRELKARERELRAKLPAE